MNLQDYKKQYEQLSEKKCLSGKEALEAVKRNGDALRYVNEQTEEICLEAVKQDGDALRYVNSKFFNENNLSGKEIELKIDGVIYKAIIK